MMSNLPADIEVQEPLTGAFRETHYRLPRRTLPGAKLAAGVGLAGAIGCTVRVVSRARKGENSMNWTTLLQIDPVEGPVHVMLASREKSELEWLATTLSKALGLPLM